MKNRHMLYGLIIVSLSIIADQVTKMFALLKLKGGDLDIIENFFSLRLHYNDGAAWSSFAGNFPFLVGMTLVSIIAFAFFFKSVNFKTKLFYSIGISLMFGGLFGNFIDRLFMDGNVVIDFLSFTFGTYRFPTFNIADSCLVVGVVLFIIDILFFEGRRRNESI